MLIIVSLLLFALVVLERKVTPFSYMYVLLIFFLFMLTGAINVSLHSPYILEKELQDTFHVAKLDEGLKERGKTYQGISSLYIGGEKIKIWVNFEKDSALSLLEIGDEYIFWGKVEAIKNKGNPGEFDFESYAKKKGVTSQAYHRIGSWERLANDRKFSFRRVSVYIQSYLCGVLDEWEIGKGHKGMLKAFLLGYKEDLPKDTRLAYAKAGASHILAISGLHVGILYLLILYFIKLLPVVGKSEVGRAVLLLLFLWVFAFITGFSNSVVRAVMMFSFLQIGKLLRRAVNPFNSLFASAFILLVINPYNIYDVGFQLSYSAVLSIFTFYQPFNNLFFHKFELLNKLWGLLSLTLAAQIGTLPLVIYYFKVFPTYFLLTNFWVFIFVAVILYMGVLNLVLSVFSINLSLISYVLDFIMDIFNVGISSIASMPFSVIQSTQMGKDSFVCLLLSVFILVVAFIFKKKIFILYSCLFFTLFLAIEVISEKEEVGQKKIIVYNCRKNILLSCVQGKMQNAYVFKADSLQEGGTEEEIVESAGVHIGSRVYSLKVINHSAYVPILNFENKKIAIINKAISHYSFFYPKLEVDFLIIGGGVWYGYDSLVTSFRPKVVVLAHSLGRNSENKLMKICNRDSIELYQISRKGAFIKDLRR